MTAWNRGEWPSSILWAPSLEQWCLPPRTVESSALPRLLGAVKMPQGRLWLPRTPLVHFAVQRGYLVQQARIAPTKAFGTSHRWTRGCAQAPHHERSHAAFPTPASSSERRYAGGPHQLPGLPALCRRPQGGGAQQRHEHGVPAAEPGGARQRGRPTCAPASQDAGWQQRGHRQHRAARGGRGHSQGPGA